MTETTHMDRYPESYSEGHVIAFNNTMSIESVFQNEQCSSIVYRSASGDPLRGVMVSVDVDKHGVRRYSVILLHKLIGVVATVIDMVVDDAEQAAEMAYKTISQHADLEIKDREQWN